MNLLARLEDWREQGAISAEQQARLSGLVRQEPFSVFLELNALLYLGVLAFVAGLGWTVATWGTVMGRLGVLALLLTVLAGCCRFCWKHSPAWTLQEVPASGALVNYVLYLGALVWCLTLAYVEKEFGLLSGQWDRYLLVTAVLFLLLAYRFDNRFVLTLALSSLAGWFGISITHGSGHALSAGAWYEDAATRRAALVYCAVVGTVGWVFRIQEWKAHLLGTYLNLVANVLFCAVLAGVFERGEHAGAWLLGLVAACAASAMWGIRVTQFSFVAYAAVYGYVGFSYLLVHGMQDDSAITAYFLITAVAMVVALVVIGRNFGKAAL